MLLGVVGCSLLSFDVDQDLPQQTIPGSPLGPLFSGPLGSPIPFQFDVRSETARRNTGPASSAALKVLRLQATPHGTSTNFDFLDEIHVFISSAGLPMREIANSKPVPRGQTVLNLTVIPNVDLLPYINAGAQLTAQATGRQPTSDFGFDGHVTVTIHL